MSCNDILKNNIGNKEFTNIIFKSKNIEVIRKHLESLDSVYLDFNLNKLDINILSVLLKELRLSIRKSIYNNLTKRKLLVILASLNLDYLLEYLIVVNNMSFLKDYVLILHKSRMSDYYNLINTRYRIYEYTLLNTDNYNLNKYLLERFPERFFLERDMYRSDKLVRSVVLHSNKLKIKELVRKYPQDLVEERGSKVNE